MSIFVYDQEKHIRQEKDEIEPIYNLIREETGGYTVQSSEGDETAEVK